MRRALSPFASPAIFSRMTTNCTAISAEHASDSRRNRKAAAARRAILRILSSLVLAISVCHASDLRAPTSAAFDEYVRDAQARMPAASGDAAHFLWIDDIPWQQRSKAYADLRAGRVTIENVRDANSATPHSVPGGLIHDWRGLIFVPGVTLDQTLALLEDYDHDADYFSPDVTQAKLLSRDGENFRVYLRLKRKYVITAIYDTEYEIHYTKLDAARAYSESRSTKIEEVENAGRANEKHAAAGEDHGFLWRLNTYWRFEQAYGGVFIQCEAISLSRDVPQGMGWAVNPFVEKIPRESLRFTLQAARAALLKKYPANKSNSIPSGENR